jgi:hypothetical protein
MSLLFEWISPRNQIVIKYDSPEIYLVGAVFHGKDKKWFDTDFDLIDIHGLKKISEETSISLVKHFNLKNKADVINLIAKLKNEKEIEGYVIRMNNDQDLVKCKSDNYFILHALKSNLKSESLIDLWLAWDRPDFCVFQHNFETNYDFETWTTIMPAVCSMYDGIKIANSITDHIRNFVEENEHHLSRKDFALMAKQKYQGDKLAACFTMLDRRPLKHEFIKSLILQNSKHYEFSMFKKDIKNENI